MPLDFTKPVVTDNFSVSVLPGIVQAFTSLAQMLDPAVAGTLTGTPTGAYRINGVNLERYNGTTWSTYTLNIAGSAATVAGWAPAPTTTAGPTWGSQFPIVKSDGSSDIGKTLDFHEVTSDAGDFTVRLQSVSGVLQLNSNVVVHSANYNTYAPTLTGTGASGTWAITAANANAVPWTGVSSRPTALSSFTNDVGYITTATTVAGIAPATAGAVPTANQIIRTDGSSNAYTGYINASHTASELATPAQFIVGNGTDNFYRRSSAAQAAAAIQAAASGSWAINISGTAAVASSVAWTSVSGRPTNVSTFTNDAAYASLTTLTTIGGVGCIMMVYLAAVSPSTWTGAVLQTGTSVSGSDLRATAVSSIPSGWSGQPSTAPFTYITLATTNGSGVAPTTQPLTPDQIGTWKILSPTRRPSIQGALDDGNGGFYYSLTIFPVLAIRTS